MTRPDIVVMGNVPPPLTGAANVTAQVIERLRSEGADLSILNRVPSAPSPLRSLHCELTALTRLARVAARPGTTYIQANSGARGYFDIILALMSRMGNRNIAVHHHSFSYIQQPTTRMKLLTLASGRSSDRHIFLCNHMSSSFQEIYGEIQELVIDNRVWVPEAQGDTPSKHYSSLHLAMIGALTPSKGALRAARVAKQCADRLDRPVVLTLIGHAEHEIVQEIESLCGTAQVRHLGVLSRHETIAKLGPVHCLLQLSTYPLEAAPLSIVEARRQSCWVLASSAGCIPELAAPDPGIEIVDVDRLDISEEAERIVMRYETREGAPPCPLPAPFRLVDSIA